MSMDDLRMQPDIMYSDQKNPKCLINMLLKKDESVQSLQSESRQIDDQTRWSDAPDENQENQ